VSDIPESQNEAGNVLAYIAHCERMADEVWLLPYAASHKYEKHFADATVRVSWLPGVFGAKDWFGTRRLRAELEKGLEKEGLKGHPIVGVHAGGTGVWGTVQTELKKVKLRKDDRTAPVVIAAKGDKVVLLGNSQEKEIADMSGLKSRIPLIGAQDMGITRGGITILDHIVAGCPVAVTEEPFHWLSAEQRGNVAREGLCFRICLDNLRNDPKNLIRHLMSQDKEAERERMKHRMKVVVKGVEKRLARHLCKQYLA
jgi:hypothetical protein